MRSPSVTATLVFVVSACASAIAGCQRVDQEPVASSTQGLTSQQIAANHLTEFLGVPVLPADVKTYSGSHEFIPGYTAALATMLLTNQGTLLFAKHHTPELPFVSVAIRAPLRPELMNASVVVSELASSQDVQCTINICDTNGHCSGLTGVFDQSECNKPPLCSSDADCEALSTRSCYVRQCGLGMCVAHEVQTNSGFPCPTDSCGSDDDCASSKKTCPYKKCWAGLCTATTVEVDMNDPCPQNDCEADDECGGLTGPPVIDDIGF